MVERAADGASNYKVEMGATTEHTDVLAFNRPALDLKVGDRVTFVNNSQAPHTASFAGRTTLPQDPTSPAVENPAPGPSPQDAQSHRLLQHPPSQCRPRAPYRPNR